MGAPEIGLIAGVIILLFGAKKLPDLAGSVGKSIKEFRKASKEAMVDDEPATQPPATPTPATPTSAASDDEA